MKTQNLSKEKRNILSLRKVYFLVLLFSFLILNKSNATNLIGPGIGGHTGDFTNGMADWNVMNGNAPTPNPNFWITGTPTTISGFSGNFAYITTGNSSAWSYDKNNACFTHIFQDVTIPSGEKNIYLSFDWVCKGELKKDGLQVSYTDDLGIPINPNAPGYTTTSDGAANQVGPVISGVNLLGLSQISNSAGFLNNGTIVNTVHHFQGALPSALAGTTIRVIFTWRNNNDGSGQTFPAGIDNIILTSSPQPDKALFVELFGTSIFNIDEDGATLSGEPTPFERENKLLEYALENGYKTLILKGVSDIKVSPTTFLLPDDTQYTTSQDATLEDHLAQFLNRAHTLYGVTTIASGGLPYHNSGGYNDNEHYYNINQFNIRSLGNPAYTSTSSTSPLFPKNFCFDMLYAEQDYWANEPTTNQYNNYNLYYSPGLNYMNSIATGIGSAFIDGSRRLTCATYIDDLSKVPLVNPACSAAVQAAYIDSKVDIIYLTFYFKGRYIDKPCPTDPNCNGSYDFFNNDRKQGKRLEIFSGNGLTSHIVPLFAASGATTSNKDYFGQFLINQNGIVRNDDTPDVSWHGTVDDVRAEFDLLYNTIPDPYNEGTSPNDTRTMKEITETYATSPNDMSIGSGWFKYGVMPNSPFYITMDPDNLGVPIPTFTITPIEHILSGTKSIDATTGITGLSVLTANYKWYLNGAHLPSKDGLTQLPCTLSFSTPETYTFELVADASANNSGQFEDLIIRKDIRLQTTVPNPTGGEYWKLTDRTYPSCPNFDNGSATIFIDNPSCSGMSYIWCDALGNALSPSQTSTTGHNLHANTDYILKAYCGNGSFHSSYTINLFNIDIAPHPKVLNLDYAFNCYAILSTGTFETYQWNLAGTPISGATNQTYTALVNGNYSVTVTNGSCTGTSDVYELNMTPTPTISGSDITCLYTGETVKTYTVPADPNNATYTWSVPTAIGFTSSTDGNNLTITSWGSLATIGGTIGCTVTNACGISATAENFIVKGCCISPTTDDLNNETRTLTSTAQTLTGTFNLNGTLSLTGSGILEFDGADVSISKGSKILVASGCTLKINNSSYLHACSSDLWDGIVLEDGARIEINDSRIEDAYTAVYCNKTSSFSIISSIFNNNNTAVFIHGTGINSLVDGYVRNSVFTARSLTGSPTIDDLKSTNNSINLSHYTKSIRKGYVGFDVENIGKGTTPLYNLKIGDESYSYANGGNVFDNHDYGVRIKNSNVEVVNNKFQEMEGYDKPPVSRGIGVWASQDGNLPNHYSIKVGGYATNEKNTFTDCGIGTLINEYENAIVVKNLITKTVGLGSYSGTNYNGRLGIKLTNSGISNYDCSTNTITNIYRGIEWAQNASKLVNCFFIHNVISTSVETEICHSAIYLHGPQIYDVTSSSIYVENNYLANVWNGIVAENFLTTGDFTIRGNIDILLSASAESQFGIFAQRCGNIRITDNNSIHSDSYRNLRAIGIYLSNSNSAKIDCNSIFDIGTCIGLNGDCRGNQDGVLHRNIFSDYSTGFTILPNTQLNSSGTSTYAADNQWNNSGGRVDINNLSGPLTFYLRSLSSSTYKPSKIIGTGVCTLSLSGGNSNATCSSTSTSTAASTILTSDDRMLIRMLSEGDIDFTVLAPQTKWLFSGIAFYRLMNDSTLDPSDTILGNFLDSLQNTNIGKFYAIDEAIEASNWSQAESDNQSISAQNHIEDNLKKYNNYYLAYRIDSTLATDSTWLADMVSDLGPIAAECYSTGGPATPSARMLLSYFTNQIFNEGDDCYKTPLDSIIADSANSVCDLIKQYSVPASANVTYTWTVPSGASFTQSSNTIVVNWGSTISTGGTITCSVMDTLGNSSYASYTEDSLTTAPTCPTVTANNTSCVTATSLSWTASGCAAGYQITLWTGTGTPNYVLYMQDIGYTSTFALPVLSPTTTYYYQIVPYDYHDSVYSACSTNSFTSGASQAVSPTLTTTITLGAESATAPALPCGTLVENYDGLGTSYWYTSTTAPRTGSNHMRIDKNPDNTTNLDDWFFSPPINVTAGKVYRVTWYDRIASGTTMEYYSVYFGMTMADATTMSGGTPGFNGMANSTTYHKDSATDFLATSTGQIYFGFRATSPHNQGSLYIDDIQVKEMQVTALTSGSCNTTLSSSNTINVTAVSGATNYQYKFVGTGGQSGYNYTHGTFNSATSFDIISKAPGVIYGYTYNVSASFKKNNIWSPFGASCPVTLSAFPQNKLADNPSTPGYCDYTVTDQHDLIGVMTIPGASKYQYKIVENDTTNSYVYDTTSTTFNAVGELRLDMTTISPKVRYDYYYNVQVRGLVGSTNATYGNRPGEWGTYGQTCVVHVSGKPTTSLTSTYCNTNLTTLNDVFSITPISSASIYRYHVTASGYDNTIATSNSNTDFRLTLIPTSGSPGGVKYGTVYTIEAAAYVGGEWLPYGSSCTLTTPTAPKTKLQTSDCNISISSGATSLHWNSIYGASNYQYKVSGDYSNGYRSHEVYRNNALTDFHLSQANQSGSTILANKTYYVQVRYYAGQWEAYGDSCSITTNSNYSRYLDSLLFEESKLSILSMNVFPNPNSYLNEFSVEFDGLKESNQKVDLSIFNALGKSVYHAKIVTKEETQFVIKPDVKLPPGLYVIMGEVNGERLQRKFVVD